MSFWQTVKTEIRDLDVFSDVCKKYGAELDRNKKEIRLNGRVWGRLESRGTGFNLSMDTDRNYSPLAGKVITRNGGNLLTRDYAEGMVMKQFEDEMVQTVREEQPDGRVVLRIAVGM